MSQLAHLHGKTLLEPEQLHTLHQRSNLWGTYLSLHAWATILGTMAVFVWWSNPVTYVLAVIVIGGRQLGLAILMHDAAHRALFDSSRVNDWVGRHVLGGPIGADMDAYRPYHLTHHRHTQTQDDPDLELSAPFPISRASLWRKVKRDLLGITAYQRRLEQYKLEMGEGPLSTRLLRLWRAEWRFVVSNALLLAVLSAAGHPWLFVSLWLLPMATWYQLASRVRNIAEHAVVGPGEDPLRNTRTTRANWLERVLWAPYWVNYHLEHHLFLYTPCWRLPQAHAWLGERNLWPQMEIAENYSSVLRKATSGSDDRSGGGRKTTRVQAI